VDGFRGGDPDVKQAAANRRDRDAFAGLPDQVDVLIAGTGPAGLCLAAQLAHFPEIETMIVEASPRNIENGKADGINTLIPPREGGYLFRMYVELDKLNPDERVSNRKFSQDDMIASANRIIQPYAIDVNEVVWWSIYEIGHRMSDRFDDVPLGEDRNPHVFIAGYACHTHSPETGQGMNVSMQDTFNLGWKLAHVLTGRADARLLRSYQTERWAEAKRLVDTDHEWARIMSAPPGQSELDKGDEPRFVRAFKENLEFTGGLAVQYDLSELTTAPTFQELAKGQEIGRRFHSAPVVRLADSMHLQLGHVAEADGR
jgi:phenol 2-monooxygenase